MQIISLIAALFLITGEVTLVELKAKRHLKATRKFDVSYPSNIAENRINLLNDGVTQCFPDNELYFTTVQEQYPMIEIDLKMTRIVKGVIIYLRVDALAPELGGKSTSCVFTRYSLSHGKLYQIEYKYLVKTQGTNLKLYNRVFAKSTYFSNK
jgi:hypothetical protein